MLIKFNLLITILLGSLIIGIQTYYDRLEWSYCGLSDIEIFENTIEPMVRFFDLSIFYF
jgi:hypothetical protein